VGEGLFSSLGGHFDKLDGRAAQTVEYGDMPVMELTDNQLLEIAAGALRDNATALRALPSPLNLSALRPDET
jgi:hypothetical protein